jgi:3-isopropylmalate/(R)-2-methylmalate dehydratase small subunit
MKAITHIQSRTVVLPTGNVDTDQIIPARFLTTTSRAGLGEFLFHDLRFDRNGGEIADFVLNQPEANGCEILVCGHNLGCGSSREHASWALLDYGIRAVISTEIADIFRNNSLKNGLVPIVVDPETHHFLLQNPGIDLDIDIRQSTLTLPHGRVVEFPIDAFARYCLVEGIDQLGFLRNQLESIQHFEETRTWTP